MVDQHVTLHQPGLVPAAAARRRWPCRRAVGRVRRVAAASFVGIVLFGSAMPASALAATPLAPAIPLAASTATPVTAPTGGSLETAASRAGDTGRQIGLSLIGLALAVAAVILVFKRDFKEAVGVIAIGIIAVLLVSPAGINVLQDTVNLLFGSS
jgi:hypothetical protein